MDAVSGEARLFVAGLDHRSSPLELRDRVFITEAEMAGVLAELRQGGVEQAIVLSTCSASRCRARIAIRSPRAMR